MSQIKMLKPADGVEGFKKFVLDTVKLAGSNPARPSCWHRRGRQL